MKYVSGKIHGFFDPGNLTNGYPKKGWFQKPAADFTNVSLQCIPTNCYTTKPHYDSRNIKNPTRKKTGIKKNQKSCTHKNAKNAQRING